MNQPPLPPWNTPWNEPPPPPPPPWYPPAYQPRPMNAMAIAALVSAFVLAPLGIVFGHIALSQIRRTDEDGKGLAIAGLVVGYVVTGLFVLGLLFWLIVFAWVFSQVDNYPSYESYSMPITVSSQTPPNL